MALCFGGDWREDEYDDSPIGISSSMKEYVRDMDYCEQENTTMTNEKFTPGEWVTRPGNTTVMDKKSAPIAMVYRAEYYRTKEESFANAALIKAAPEMYRLLEQLHGTLERCDSSAANRN